MGLLDYLNPMKLFGGDDSASKAAIKASETTAEGYQEALDYLKEREAVPQAKREAALEQLSTIYGLEGDEAQAAYFDKIKGSPIYEAMLSGREAGEEAIMRTEGSTGMLRSGNIKENLYDYNVNLENEAFLNTVGMETTGLGGLAQLPSLSQSIASLITGKAETLGQGQVAAAQAQQTAGQFGIQNLMGGANLFMQGWNTFSDRRLKENIVKAGSLKGIPVYVFNWNKDAEELGLKGASYGMLADEVEKIIPEAVGEKHGYKTVDYSKIFKEN